MPINAIRKNETLDQLIGRVYGKLPAAQLKKVRAETLAANPHLSLDTAPVAGTVVVVPPVRGDNAGSGTGANPGASTGGDANAGTTGGSTSGTATGRDASSTADAVKVLAAAVTSYREQLEQTIDGRRAELAEDAKLLKSARFRKVVDAVPTAAALVESLDVTTKTRQKELTESRELLGKHVEALGGDLQTLLGKLP